MKALFKLRPSGEKAQGWMWFLPLFLVLEGLSSGPFSFAAARKRGSAPPPVSPAPPSAGKKVVELAPVEPVTIDLPDGASHDFGQDFQARLTTLLTKSGRVVVTESIGVGQVGRSVQALRSAEYVWPGTTTPSVIISAKVSAYRFITGSRGERVMYGFDEHRENRKDEFPLREITFEPNWFDRHFDANGTAPFDSRAGLDLGDGLSIDALFAFLTVKQARYRARLGLDLELESGLDGGVEKRHVEVSGEGFFFDLAGGYAGYSAGIRIARTDALLQVFQKAVAVVVSSVAEWIKPYPRLAAVDGIFPVGSEDENKVLLGTGPYSEIPAGIEYEDVGGTGIRLRVVASNDSGSIALLKDPARRKDLSLGMRFQEAGKQSVNGIQSMSFALRSAGDPVTQLQIPWANLPRSDLGAFAPDESRWLAFFKSIAGALLLPYRIWRSWQYDQAYHTDPDGGEDLREEWVQRQRNSSWSRQIGLDRAPKSGLLPSVGLPEDRPIVAILDTGIDYNHAALHSALWVSPDEPADSEGVRARYGWDFISGDSRPFDDHDHGTELASLVTAIEPEARILPLKVFNPWGVTHSGALVSAFRFAVQHGASVIVCGWATRHDSEALEEAVRLAQTAGVLVVAAAGDRGEDLGKVPAYPAALSKQFPGTVLTVANVDAQDRRVQVSGHFSNFNSEIVGIAAPGSGVEVLRPRLREAKPAPSSAYAAALVAGAAVRWGREMTAAQRIDRLLRESYAVPGLASEVKGGARLQIRGAPF